MELSLYLVRFEGLSLFLLSLGLLINRKRFFAMLEHMGEDSFPVLIAGVSAVGIGAASVVGYEHWSFGWMGVVTLMGWVALIKGTLILCVPGYLEQFAKLIIKGYWYTIALAVVLVVGACMLFAGYIAPTSI